MITHLGGHRLVFTSSFLVFTCLPQTSICSSYLACARFLPRRPRRRSAYKSFIDSFFLMSHPVSTHRTIKELFLLPIALYSERYGMCFYAGALTYGRLFFKCGTPFGRFEFNNFVFRNIFKPFRKRSFILF